MSAISLAQINGAQTASATYIQTSPGTPVTASTGINVNGTTLAGYGFATSPWPSTPTASYAAPANLRVKINADGGIQALSRCILDIKWGFVGNLTPGSSSGNVTYFVLPAITTSTATVAQTSGQTFALNQNMVPMTTSAATVSTLPARLIMMANDLVYLAFGGNNVQMSRGILELITTPLV